MEFNLVDFIFAKSISTKFNSAGSMCQMSRFANPLKLNTTKLNTTTAKLKHHQNFLLYGIVKLFRLHVPYLRELICNIQLWFTYITLVPKSFSAFDEYVFD